MRRVVCAAIRITNGGASLMIISPRHFDAFMRQQIEASARDDWGRAEQGFIDQHAVFMTREEAHAVASAAGQIIKRCGGDDGALYSENLY